MEADGRHVDVNAAIGGYLRDLAFAQSSPQKMYGYKRAAAAILGLDEPLNGLVEANGTLPRIPGIGPASSRVISEVLASGESPTVEDAVARSDRRADIQRRRTLRQHVLSRAEARRVLGDASLSGPAREDYLGDLQMHSEWSDGSPTVREIAEACLARGYRYAAVTDHSHGLRIAGGMSMDEAAAQRRSIDAVNASMGDRFHLLQGIEANIDATGALDLSADEAATFELVLAAPHSRLRREEDQTDRMLTAIAHPLRPHPCAPTRTHLGVARRSGRRLGSRICCCSASWCRRRDRRRSGEAGSRLHPGAACARGRVHLRTGQRCPYHDAAVVRRDRPGARATRSHSTRSHRQLLAAGPPARVASCRCVMPHALMWAARFVQYACAVGSWMLRAGSISSRSIQAHTVRIRLSVEVYWDTRDGFDDSRRR